MSITLFTIGFAETSAEHFFTSLRQSGAKRIVDVRLNNTSQLAGFTKKNDLKFFAREVCGLDYVHLPEMAPTQEMLDAYKKRKGEWQTYEMEFRRLMVSRAVENSPKSLLDLACLLCSEKSPEYCHRRLVCEYLQGVWGNVVVTHLR